MILDNNVLKFADVLKPLSLGEGTDNRDSFLSSEDDSAIKQY